nr:MAG: nucleocapsid [Rhabdoviridae sp.]
MTSDSPPFFFGRARLGAPTGRGLRPPGGTFRRDPGVPPQEVDDEPETPQQRMERIAIWERSQLGIAVREGVTDPRPRPNLLTIHRSSVHTYRRAVRVTEREEAVEYPSLWFIKNPGKRPKVVYKKWQISGPELKKTVIQGFFQDNLDLSVVAQYLVYILPKYKFKLEENWISYGVEIGHAGQEITPLSLLEIAEEVQPGTTGSIAPQDFSDIAVILLITTQYRLSVMHNRGARPEYINQVTERFKTLAPELGLTEAGLLGKELKDVKIWALEPNIRKLMAAINMFIEKTWHDELSVARIGTLVSKGRDSAVIGDLLRLQKILGLNTEGTIKWLFSPLLEVEIDAMTVTTEEYWDEQGYFFYMADMGLSKKSPYSGSANPRMHFILNAIAFFLDGQAAPTTRWIECPKVHTLLRAAILAGFALKSPGGIAPVASETPDEGQMVTLILRRMEQDDGVALDGAPRTNDWANWVMYYEQTEWEVTTQMKEWALRFRRPVGAARPGSLAEKMNSLLETL